MGHPAGPSPYLTHAATSTPDKQTIDANRAEILVLATGVLFLVSQLVLTIWLFARPRASAQREKTQRMSITRTAVTTNPAIQISGEDTDDGGRSSGRRSNLRHSSTWNGRASSLNPTGDGHFIRRRRSVGIELRDLGDPLSSPESDSDSSDVSRGCRDAGLMAAAALGMPIAPLSPRLLRSPLGTPDVEEIDSTENRSERNINIMTKSLGTPADLSPRSPRVVPLDSETMSAILKSEKQRDIGTTPFPTPAVVVSERDLANGFDDSLGVNRRATGLKNEETLNDAGRTQRRRSDTR